MKEKVIEAVKDNKVVAILRRVPERALVAAAEALRAGGINMVEVTYDQGDPSHMENTRRALETLRGEFGSRLWLGAGTVLTGDQVKNAADAGAQYVISPNVDKEVIEAAVSLGLVSIPGAFTPTEITRAYHLGADFVKLFPASELGLSYLKALKGPLGHIPLIAVGGVNADNAAGFFKAGVVAVGVGSNIVDNALINEGRFDEITALARRFVDVLPGKGGA